MEVDISMGMDHPNHAVRLVKELEEMEKDHANIPMVFSEMFKDEINAADERKLYNGIKRIVKKFADDRKTASAINEFTGVITGGATLEEILLITKDETLHPTIASALEVDGTGREQPDEA